MTEQELRIILEDTTKRIEGDLSWGDDANRSPAREFRVEVLSDADYPITVIGRYDSRAGKLSFSFIHRGTGRIYGLDLGVEHHNPTCQMVGDPHKHYWTDEYRDKMAYAAEDITEPWDHPVEVWRQFCAEAGIQHQGRLHPPIMRRDFFL